MSRCGNVIQFAMIISTSGLDHDMEIHDMRNCKVKTAVFVLYAGEHTRSIAVTTPSNVKGGIMAFAKKKVSCLSCKAPIAGGTLCNHCAPKVRNSDKMGQKESVALVSTGIKAITEIDNI